MTLNDFIKKWNGKYCEIAGATFKNQCVDIVNQYIKDVLGLPIIAGTNAKDFPSKAGDEYDYIKNTPLGLPEEGDLIIWGDRYGHIAIYLSGNVNWFTSFDQNWPTGSVCHKVDHSYKSVIGWLRKKGTNMDNQIVKQSNFWIGTLVYLEITKDKPILDDVKNVVAGLKARASQMEKEKGVAEAKVVALEETISSKDSQLLESEKTVKARDSELREALKNLKERDGRIVAMVSENERLNKENSELKTKREYDVLVELNKLKLALIKYKT